MASRPADYPPPVYPEREFVAEPTDPEGDRVAVGVVIVGGGPAGLACAIRLMQLLESEPALAESLGEVPVALVEKGRTIGSHLLSEALMEPSAMRRLFPDLDESAWPTYGTVESEAVHLLTRRHAFKLPRVPPPFRNHGNHVISIAQLGRWLGRRAKEAGVYILPETAAYRLLVKDGAVRGVRTGDKGRGRDGGELSNFESGSDLIGRVTVLAEGTDGHLTDVRHFDLGSQAPQGSKLGVKEVWEVQRPLDRVIHTIGWPLRSAAKYREFGGSFMYPMGEDKVSVGFVVGLDYRGATLSVHDLLQEFKTHSTMELSGGRFPGGHWPTADDAEVGVFIGDRHKRYPKPDRSLTFDKLGSVFLSGNATREDAPDHIRIEHNVPLAVGLMWQHMCPAQTYQARSPPREAGSRPPRAALGRATKPREMLSVVAGG